MREFYGRTECRLVWYPTAKSDRICYNIVKNFNTLMFLEVSMVSLLNSRRHVGITPQHSVRNMLWCEQWTPEVCALTRRDGRGFTGDPPACWGQRRPAGATSGTAGVRRTPRCEPESARNATSRSSRRNPPAPAPSHTPAVGHQTHN